MKNEKLKKNMENEVAIPVFSGAFWVQAISSLMFCAAPVLVSGVNGEQMTNELSVCYYELPRYCLLAIYLLFAPLLNPLIYSRKITYRRKFFLHNLTMVIYIISLVTSVMVAIDKISMVNDFPLTISSSSYIFPLTFVFMWAGLFSLEHMSLKRRKDTIDGDD